MINMNPTRIFLNNRTLRKDNISFGKAPIISESVKKANELPVNTVARETIVSAINHFDDVDPYVIGKYGADPLVKLLQSDSSVKEKAREGLRNIFQEMLNSSFVQENFKKPCLERQINKVLEALKPEKITIETMDDAVRFISDTKELSPDDMQKVKLALKDLGSYDPRNVHDGTLDLIQIFKDSKEAMLTFFKSPFVNKLPNHRTISRDLSKRGYDVTV